LAKAGDASAQGNLGFHHATGEGIRRNRQEALRLYRLAAAQGNARAMHNLGVCHRDGLGVAAS